MRLLYYPGCTVKTTGKPYEKAALGVLKEFGVEVIELKDWVCCGVYPGLAKDSYYHLVAPIRNLLNAQIEKKSRNIDNDFLLTLCSMCFNTLKSANIRYIEDEVTRERLSYFFDLEPFYSGDVKVIHFMEAIRGIVGIDNLERAVKNRLSGLKVAPFYGCYLLRPKNIGIDNPEDPKIMETILSTIGAEPIDYPYRNQCCGGYIVTKNPDAVWNRVEKIVGSAMSRGAKMIVTTCPLCAFNLEEGQKRRKENLGGTIPVFYTPELIAFALGKYNYLFEDRLEILKVALKR
ncbi:MAG: CoB--CoM heterodisulfide reductase iron-sulfur subunit B family protein [Candidatus Njordarchaeota archaeon]